MAIYAKDGFQGIILLEVSRFLTSLEVKRIVMRKKELNQANLLNTSSKAEL